MRETPSEFGIRMHACQNELIGLADEGQSSLGEITSLC